MKEIDDNKAEEYVRTYLKEILGSLHHDKATLTLEGLRKKGMDLSPSILRDVRWWSSLNRDWTVDIDEDTELITFIRKEVAKHEKMLAKAAEERFHVEDYWFGIISCILAFISILFLSPIMLLISSPVNIQLVGIILGSLGIRFDKSKVGSIIGVGLNLLLLTIFGLVGLSGMSSFL